MTTILHTDHTIIKHNKDNNIFIIEFKYSSYSLINSLLKTRLIQGGSTDEFYRTLTFKAESIKTLNQYLNDNKKRHNTKKLLVNEAAKAILQLGKQLEYLINIESKTLIGYNPNDIIVINDETFAFLNSELLTEIDEDTEFITITWPFSTNDFFVSPELLTIKEIPSQIHFKTTYFSFACLIIYCLLGDDEFYTEYIKNNNPKNIIDSLNNHIIKGTKIYWFLSRCLVDKVKDRSLLFI
jgi:hypothetical protein